MSCKPSSIVTDYIAIPGEILESRKELEALTYIMVVKKLMFLVSISQGLKFATIEYLPSKNEIVLVTFIDKIGSYYKSHVLHVGTMFVDPEFQLLD